MRIFIAVKLPDTVVGMLDSVNSRLPDGGLRKVDRKQMHLTMKFLGEVPENQIESIISCLQAVSFEPFSVSLDGVGVFPDPRNVRVVWVGLSPAIKIIELEQKIGAALTKFSFRKDFKFHPHITLARVKLIEDRKAFSDLLETVKVEKQPFQISCFHLMKSTLAPNGPVYEELASFRNSRKP
ncbi:MAG: RNA 2',3'-cyclic phosphodiesterase [archaeon]